MIRWLSIAVLILCCLSSLQGIVSLEVGYMFPQHRFDNAYDDVYSFGMEIRGWGEDNYGTEMCFEYIYSDNAVYRDSTFGVVDYYYRIIPITTTLLTRAWTAKPFRISASAQATTFRTNTPDGAESIPVAAAIRTVAPLDITLSLDFRPYSSASSSNTWQPPSRSIKMSTGGTMPAQWMSLAIKSPSESPTDDADV